MSWYETLLFLHVLAAFVLMAGVVFFGAMMIGAPRGEGVPMQRLSRLAGILWNVGGISVLVFGVWLAIYLDGYEIVDGWILLAIALWVIASGAGGKLSVTWSQAIGSPEPSAGGVAAVLRSSQSRALYAVMTVATIAMLVVMVYKPGAG